jgi:peptidoglycan/LPS O-acetylase OafA/YrhL
VAFAVMLIVVTHSQIVHWWQVPVHAALLHSLVPGENQRLFFVAWSLGNEAVFYALVPIGAALVWRAARRPAALDINVLGGVVLGLWITSVLWGLGLALRHPIHAGGTTSPVFSVLFLGVGLGNFCPGLLVFLAETDEARARGGVWARYRAAVRRPGWLLLAAVALWVSTEPLPWETDSFAFVFFHPIIGLASGLALAAVLSGLRARRVIRLLAPLGLVSYGIYLWHYVIESAAGAHGVVPFRSFGLAATLAHIVLLLLATLPLALASWLIFERPALRVTARWDATKVGTGISTLAEPEPVQA